MIRARREFFGKLRPSRNWLALRPVSRMFALGMSCSKQRFRETQIQSGERMRKALLVFIKQIVKLDDGIVAHARKLHELCFSEFDAFHIACLFDDR